MVAGSKAMKATTAMKAKKDEPPKKAMKVMKKPAAADESFYITLDGGGRMEGFTLMVQGSTTVVGVKAGITEAISVVPAPPDWMLWHGSTLLRDGHNLAFYGLQEGSLLTFDERDTEGEGGSEP
jgi:hypothetical protein